MNDGVDLELDLEGLFAEPTSRVSKVPEVREVEVVRSAKDPALGFIVVLVQGLLSEDRIALGRQYDAALRVYTAVQEAQARRAKELNPDGLMIGDAFAEAKSQTEASPWHAKAIQNLLKACAEICAVGVVGWAPGQLRYRGQELVYSQEEQLILSRPRMGLNKQALRWLEAGWFSFRLAASILAVSDARPTLTKEQQWGKEETPAKAAPLGVAGLAGSPQTSA